MAPSSATLPLIGRSSELALLVELLPRAAEGPCQVALIEGEAGIGKTRLLAEVLDRVGFRNSAGHAEQRGPGQATIRRWLCPSSTS
jgi:DNA-binding NtrC family response regulator